MNNIADLGFFALLQILFKRKWIFMAIVVGVLILGEYCDPNVLHNRNAMMLWVVALFMKGYFLGRINESDIVV